jgi:hypothetical protein
VTVDIVLVGGPLNGVGMCILGKSQPPEFLGFDGQVNYRRVIGTRSPVRYRYCPPGALLQGNEQGGAVLDLASPAFDASCGESLVA